MCALSTIARGDLVDRARRGDGPGFLLCNTYRYHGHHVGDINREYYRSKAEEQHWKTERDPIANLGKWLIEQKLAELATLEQVQTELEAEMKKAVEFASRRAISRRQRSGRRTSMPEAPMQQNVRKRPRTDFRAGHSRSVGRRDAPRLDRLHHGRGRRRGRHAIQSSLRPGRRIRQRVA